MVYKYLSRVHCFNYSGLHRQHTHGILPEPAFILYLQTGLPKEPLRLPLTFLVFSDGGTYNVTGIITQTIGQIAVSNNTKVTLQSAAAATLTIAGGDGTDLSVAALCELNATSTTAVIISLSYRRNR